MLAQIVEDNQEFSGSLMHNDLFDRFAPVIRKLSPSELAGDPSISDKLRITDKALGDRSPSPCQCLGPKADGHMASVTSARFTVLIAVSSSFPSETARCCVGMRHAA